jgi:hypothetical protein
MTARSRQVCTRSALVGVGLRKTGLCLTVSSHRGIRPTIVAITPAADRPIMIQS